MPIYRPTNVYPNFDTVDGTKDCEFTWQFKGTNCEGYKIDLYDSTGTLKTTTNKITYSVPLQNNDIATHTISANTMIPNGDTFSWGLTLYGDKYDTLVARGRGVFDLGKKIQSYNDIEPGTISVGMKIRAKRNGSTWFSLGEITSVVFNTITFSVDKPYSPDIPDWCDYEIYNNNIEITPHFVIYTANESQVSIDNIPSEILIDKTTQTFTATYNQPNDIPFLRYYWELYRGDVKIDETDYLTSNNIEYTYKGFVDAGEFYTLKLTLEDKLGRIVSDEKTYQSNYFGAGFGSTNYVTIKKGYNMDGCTETGCIEIDWSNVPSPSVPTPNHPENCSYDRVVISREEDGSGIFNFIAEVDVSTGTPLKDYNIKHGTSYCYKVVWYDSTDSSEYPMRFIGTSSTMTYQTNFWFVIGLDDLSSKTEGTYTVNPNNVWAFGLNIENSPQAQNEYATIYNTLGQFPRISKGKGNYISSGLSCLIGNVSQGGSYNEPKHIIEKWRQFCNENTVKLVRDRNGSAMLCALTDNTSQTSEFIPSTVNSVSFTYTEIMKNKTPIIGE